MEFRKQPDHLLIYHVSLKYPIAANTLNVPRGPAGKQDYFLISAHMAWIYLPVLT